MLTKTHSDLLSDKLAQAFGYPKSDGGIKGHSASAEGPGRDLRAGDSLAVTPTQGHAIVSLRARDRIGPTMPTNSIHYMNRGFKFS